MIIASSHHNPLLAFVKPKKQLQQNNTVPWEEFVNTPEAEKAVLKELEKVFKTARLKTMERISAVKLFPHEWTPENGWMTAAMKVRRQDLQKEHADLIESMFKKVESSN